MEAGSQNDRAIRAARNQSLFRVINEKMRGMNDQFAWLAGTFTIACECADMNCVETMEVDPQSYLSMRDEPRQFAVLPGHVYPDVEVVVRESEGYVVVEKMGEAGAVAESLTEQSVSEDE
jgi:hypothetical protein